MIDLGSLADRYRRKYGWSGADVEQGLQNRLVAYAKRRQDDLADAVAIGVALEGLLVGKNLDLGDLSPAALEAFHAAFPRLSLDNAVQRGTDGVADLINAWKGKLFEVEVRDRLNDGEWVGNWHLASGEIAELAHSASQPGWDLAIHDPSGAIINTIQLKATESFSYVNDALQHYPDIAIIATNDLAEHAHVAAGLSVDSDTSVSDVGHEITDAIDAADGLGLPQALAPGVVIAVTEIMAVASGRKSTEEAIESGIKRGAISVISAGIGAFISFVLGPWFGLPAAMAARMLLHNATSSRTAKIIEGSYKVVDIDGGTPVSPETSRAFQQLVGVTERLALKYSPGSPRPA